ncbi:hypothetical protein ACYSNO_03265 [Enterococcus sp. LJL98]
MLKKLSIGILSIIGGLSLVACSSNDTTQGKSNVLSTRNSTISFVTESQSKKDIIWYLLDPDNEEQLPIAKMARVQGIIHTKDGQGVAYNMTSDNYYLKDLIHLEDTQIIEFAKQSDEDKFQKKINDEKERFNENYSYAQELIEKYNAIGENEYKPEKFLAQLNENLPLIRQDIDTLDNINYQNPKFIDIKAKVKTDNTGKETVSESIVFPYMFLKSSSWSINSDYHNIRRSDDEIDYQELTDSLTFEYPVATTQVLDYFFTGFVDKDFEQSVVTKVKNENVSAKLDSIDTKNVEDIDK